MVELLKSLLPLLGPVALLAVALVPTAQYSSSSRRARVVRRALLAGASVVLVAALGTAALRVWLGAYTASPFEPGAQLLSFRIDSLSVTMLLMVGLLAFVISRFSATYLQGDSRHDVFLRRLALTAASVQMLVLANHLLLFWMAWTATSVCLHQLLVFYPDRRRAVIAARKKFITARIGDALLAGALVSLSNLYGTSEIDEIASLAQGNGGGLLTAGTVLLALAALVKSAQFPLHSWLVEVTETPTPVSALLHAGILNAGPYLVLRFSPVMENAQLGNWLLLIVGGFTAAFASTVLRTQPSVKVALGYSSAAHMGFSLFVCGLGLYSAAALHLIAHSFYKAHSFLSAGSTADAHAAKGDAKGHSAGLALTFCALLASAGLYFGVAALSGATPWENPGMLVLSAILIVGLTQLVGSGLGLRQRPGASAHVLFGAALVVAAFFGLEGLARDGLQDSLPHVVDSGLTTLVIAGGVVAAWATLVVVQLSGWGRGTLFAQHLRVHLRNGLYINTLFDRFVAPRPRSGARAAEQSFEQVIQS